MIDSVALNKNRMLSVLFLHSLMGMKIPRQLVLLSFHIISETVCISNVHVLNWKGMTWAECFCCMETQQYSFSRDEWINEIH